MSPRSPAIDVAIIRSNPIIHDPRVQKIVRSLCKRYSTLSLGWDRERLLSGSEDQKFGNLKVFRLRAPVGKFSLIAYLPLFWLWVLLKLLAYRPKVVHACDLDTVLPCYIYKIIFKKRIIFDVFDRYAMAFIPLKSKRLYSAVNSIEELFSRNADVLVTVSENLMQTFHRTGEGTSIILNCPENYIIDAKTNKKNKIFTLVYTGAIVRNRGLEKLVSVLRSLTDVQLIIAGKVIDEALFDQVRALPNTVYAGILHPSDALAFEASADVMVVLYSLDDPINNYAMPNKIFEAMLLGLPIISNVASELINEANCGIIVEYNNLEEIKSSIVQLKNNTELRNRLGRNGHKAYRQKYNWERMEYKLYSIYESLLGNN